MTDSNIHVTKGGTAFNGPDAVALFRAISLRAGLGLLAKGIRPNRAWTPTKVLAAAGELTGQVYRRGEYERARRDLNTWIETMKSALPVEVE